MSSLQIVSKTTILKPIDDDKKDFSYHDCRSVDRGLYTEKQQNTGTMEHAATRFLV